MSASPITGEVVSADIWLDQVVGHHVAGDLDTADAMTITARIKAYAGATWVLLAAAHERKAHKAMGYATWADYVQTEFDMSRSRSYQLISQARVVLEISAAVSTDVDTEGVSTMVDISEREARDLEPVLDEAKEAAAEAVADLPPEATPEDKASAVTAALDNVRQAMVTKRRSESTTTIVPTAGEEVGTAGENPGVATAPASDPDAVGADAVGQATENTKDSDVRYRERLSSARKAALTLTKLDAERCAAVSLVEDRESDTHFVEMMRGWLDQFDAALRRSQIRSVG